MKDYITYCLSGLLFSLGVKHTHKKLNRSILTHPFNYTVKGVANTLDEYRDSVRVLLRLLVTDSKDNLPYLVAAYLLALSQKLSPKELLNTCVNLFSTTDYTRWTTQYPLVVTDKELNEVAKQLGKGGRN
jgi:hypothetical protein